MATYRLPGKEEWIIYVGDRGSGNVYGGDPGAGQRISKEPEEEEEEKPSSNGQPTAQKEK